MIWLLWVIGFTLGLLVTVTLWRWQMRRVIHPAPLGYVRLADRYFQDRSGYRGD